MVGNGDYSYCMMVKKGERVMVSSGRNSYFIEAGLTPEESRIRHKGKLSDILYSKPITGIKKLVRKIKE